MDVYSKREIVRLLKESGYKAERTSGSHQTWSNGEKIITVPIARLKPIIAKKIYAQIRS